MFRLIISDLPFENSLPRFGVDKRFFPAKDYIIFIIRIQNKSLIHTADASTRDNDQKISPLSVLTYNVSSLTYFY